MDVVLFNMISFLSSLVTYNLVMPVNGGEAFLTRYLVVL